MKFSHIPSILVVLLVCFFSACSTDVPEEIAVACENLPEQIDFNFHVRPILSDRCYSCHGPDEASRKADLRLDLEEHAFAKLTSGNGRAIVAGNPNKSQLVQRILSDDPDYVMPTPESNLTLTREEKAILIKWIEQGAEWKAHWAFETPELPEIPKMANENWTANNPIDNFILAQLPYQNLEPSPRADKERLIRRVSMDLTGLAPSIAEIDDFLTDDSPDAYEKIVDRLLASDAYGERMAMDWMDLARYADSHGMHADGYRMMWQWRDWVIKALNENMPYNEFVTWQLAGDLFPNATKEQKLATAFNRNHPMTAEGGVIDEEFRLEYVFDRAETMSTAFMGLTLECARCHDHKFDPISQKEYYEMAAFFNNVKELGMAGDDGNYGPMLMLPDSAMEAKLTKLREQISNAGQALELSKQELLATRDFVEQLPRDDEPLGLVAHYPLDHKTSSKSKNEWARYSRHSKPEWANSIFDKNVKAISGGDPEIVEGKIGNAVQLTGEYDEIHLQDVGIFESYEAYSAGAWINTSKRQAEKTQTILGTSGDKNNYWRGWDLYLDTINRPSVRLIHSLPHNYIQILAIDSIQINEWTHIFFTYDGSSKAEGLKLYVNGQLTQTEIKFNNLYKGIHPVTGGANAKEKRPLRVGKSYRSFTGENGILLGKVDDVRLYSRALHPDEVARIVRVDSEQNAFKISPEIYAEQSPTYRSKLKALQSHQQAYLDAMEEIPEVMVMEEMPKARPMFVLNRGEYSSPTYEVGMNTVAAVGKFPEALPKDRLGLSKWLFSENNPLTARVAVNRHWQQLFGEGIVKTPHDFGVQGALPTHPKLLDWLAIQYQESGWNTKALLKLIVMSATYQQASKATPEVIEQDPENVYLARGASYRWQAEVIRDHALNASGLLVQKIGGVSVRPYQPEGLWIEKGNFSHKLLRYKETKGDSLYRRSLYTFVKRTSPHPAMTAFDAPNRDVCVTQRESTNTPLQALVLLNDPQFVEASRVLAERLQQEGGNQLQDRIVYAFRLCTGRHPKAVEVELLKELYIKQMAQFEEQPKEAQALLAVGEHPVNPNFDPMETAAYAVLASTLLNHDEAYMKR